MSRPLRPRLPRPLCPGGGTHQDQWQAYIAAWLGWTLDAFDFTIFLLIMLPISRSSACR